MGGLRGRRVRWRWVALVALVVGLGSVALAPASIGLSEDFQVEGTVDCGVRSGRRCTIGDTLVLWTADVSGVRERVAVDVSWIRRGLPTLEQDDLVCLEVRHLPDGRLQAIGRTDLCGLPGTVNPGLTTEDREAPEQPKPTEEDGASQAVAAPTATASASATASATATATPVPMQEVAPATPTLTPPATATPTLTPTPTATPTLTPTPAPFINLTVDKTHSPEPGTVGQPLTSTVTVTNTGTLVATGVVVRDVFVRPAGNPQFISLPPPSSGFACDFTTATAVLVEVTCTGGTVAAGGSVTLETDLNPLAPGAFTNTATVDPGNLIPESDEGDNVATDTATFT